MCVCMCVLNSHLLSAFACTLSIYRILNTVHVWFRKWPFTLCVSTVNVYVGELYEFLFRYTIFCFSLYLPVCLLAGLGKKMYVDFITLVPKMGLVTGEKRLDYRRHPDLVWLRTVLYGSQWRWVCVCQDGFVCVCEEFQVGHTGERRGMRDNRTPRSL